MRRASLSLVPPGMYRHFAAVAIWFFSGMSGSEVAKDNAIADAAGEVGEAASQVGDAAQDAAGAVTN